MSVTYLFLTGLFLAVGHSETPRIWCAGSPSPPREDDTRKGDGLGDLCQGHHSVRSEKQQQNCNFTLSVERNWKDFYLCEYHSVDKGFNFLWSVAPLKEQWGPVIIFWPDKLTACLTSTNQYSEVLWHVWKKPTGGLESSQGAISPHHVLPSPSIPPSAISHQPKELLRLSSV